MDYEEETKVMEMRGSGDLRELRRRDLLPAWWSLLC